MRKTDAEIKMKEISPIFYIKCRKCGLNIKREPMWKTMINGAPYEYPSYVCKKCIPDREEAYNYLHKR